MKIYEVCLILIKDLLVSMNNNLADIRATEQNMAFSYPISLRFT